MKGVAPMYRLYYYPTNASMAPHMVVREIGAAHELVLVDRTRGAHKAADYLKLNPNGLMPTLVDGDLVLFESAAICLHLCDRHPEAGLAPPLGTPERAHFYKWLIHLTNTIQPEMLLYFYPERYAPAPGDAEAVKAGAERRMTGMFRLIDRELAASGRWLAGGSFSAADLFLYMLGRWGRGFAEPPRDLPALGPHLARVLDRRAVREVLEIEGIEPPFL